MAQEPNNQKSREERLAERQAMIEARRAEAANRPAPTAEEVQQAKQRSKEHLQNQIARLQERLSQLDAEKR